MNDEVESNPYAFSDASDTDFFKLKPNLPPLPYY